MAGLSTLSDLPSVVYAGDTLLFSISGGDYPPPDWSLSYAFRSQVNDDDGNEATEGHVGGTAIEFVSTQSGSNHLVSVAATVTAGWLPMEYSGVCRVVHTSGQKFTVWTGRLKVHPDLSQQPDNFDGRTHAQICLDKIEAVLENRAGRDVLNSVIAGQQINRLTPEQLIFWRNYYRQEVAAEKAAELAAAGKATGNNILIRFGSCT